MKQDVNKIVDNLSQEWAQQSAVDKKRLAIMSGEIKRLKAELEELKSAESEGE